MTEYYRFFDATSGDRVYTSANMTEVLHRLLGDGVIRLAANRLAVTAGAGVSVNVDTGEYMELGYWYKSDASRNIALATPDATNPRIDLIVVRLNVSAGVRSITVTNKSGTPAPSPSAPALEQDSTIWEESLASVLVPAGSGTPLTITDLRAYAGDQTQRSSAPETPAAGTQPIYPKTDGRWYTKLPSGTEATVGEIESHASGTFASAGTTITIPSASKLLMVTCNGLDRTAVATLTNATTVTLSETRYTGDAWVVYYVAS